MGEGGEGGGDKDCLTKKRIDEIEEYYGLSRTGNLLSLPAKDMLYYLPCPSSSDTRACAFSSTQMS